MPVRDRERAFSELGLPAYSSWDEVRRAYSRLVKKYHPDTSRTGDPVAFGRVLEAYRTLSAINERDENLSSIFALGEQAVSGDSPRERAFACSRLGALGRRSAAGYLQRALFDGDEQVAITAANALGRIGVLSAAGSFTEAFYCATPRLRAAIINAACTIGPFACFRPLFIEALREPAPEWRKRALRMFLSIDASGRRTNGRSA